MLLIVLSLLSWGGDRTACQKRFATVGDPGVLVMMRSKCKREKEELGRKGLCLPVTAYLSIPDPFDENKLRLKTTEFMKLEDLRPESMDPSKEMSIHDAWIETDTPVGLIGADGKTVDVPLRSRAQVKESVDGSEISYELDLTVTEAQLRHLRKVGLDGWTYTANGHTITHLVKKVPTFAPIVDCVLDGA